MSQRTPRNLTRKKQTVSTLATLAKEQQGSVLSASSDRNFALGAERWLAKKDVVDVVIPRRKFSAGLIESTPTNLPDLFLPLSLLLFSCLSSLSVWLEPQVSSVECSYRPWRSSVISDDNEAEIREGSILQRPVLLRFLFIFIGVLGILVSLQRRLSFAGLHPLFQGWPSEDGCSQFGGEFREVLRPVQAPVHYLDKEDGAV